MVEAVHENTNNLSFCKETVIATYMAVFIPAYKVNVQNALAPLQLLL